jgi:tRNA U34 2-thiouridine synthase MnmA/TrmU
MNITKKVKSGAEKKRLKRSAKLKSVASDPKQTKICFVSQSKATNSIDVIE